jgi:hypothetical protein
MAAEEQTFSLADVAVTGLPPEMVRAIYRRRDHTFMLIFELDVKAVLPDGRIVRWNRHVTVPYTELLDSRLAAAI